WSAPVPRERNAVGEPVHRQHDARGRRRLLHRGQQGRLEGRGRGCRRRGRGGGPACISRIGYCRTGHLPFVVQSKGRGWRHRTSEEPRDALPAADLWRGTRGGAAGRRCGRVPCGHAAFTADVKARGLFQAGEALTPTSTATTVRVVNGETVTTDGPFAETKEALGGFYLIEARDLDEAIETAAKIPAAKEGSIEVRPIWELPAEYAMA